MKPDIIVNHSNIEIREYELGDSSKLENMLSYWDKVNFKLIALGYYYDEETETMFIPRGIDIEYVAKLLNRRLVLNDKANKLEKCIINLNTLPRDDDQKKIISFLTGERDYKFTKQHSQLLLEGETGIGKTYCTIAYLSYMKQKSAIILDEMNFIDQWKKSFLEYTDIREDEMNIIRGSKMIFDVIENPKKYNHKIHFISNKSLNRFGSTYGYSKLNDLFKAIKVGIKVFDEAHACFANIIKIDCSTNVKRTIYLTATAGRSEEKQNKIFKTVFKGIPTFGQNLIRDDERYINTFVFIYNSFPDIIAQSKCRNIHGFDTKAYLDYCFGRLPATRQIDKDTFEGKLYNLCRLNSTKPRDNIFDIIEYMIISIYNKEGKIAILFNKNEHIQIFKNYITSNLTYINPDDVGIFSSIVKDKEERRKQLDKKIILTTDKSFGKGIDVKDLRVFVNTLSYRSHIHASQFMGRLRKNKKFSSIYVEIVDRGFKSSFDQYKDRRKTLSKKSKSVREIKI